MVERRACFQPPFQIQSKEVGLLRSGKINMPGGIELGSHGLVADTRSDLRSED